MFEKIKEKINNKSIECYVENQLSEPKDPLDVKISLRIFSVDILCFFIFLFLLSSPNFFTGIDRFGIFGVTYAELFLNYIIILAAENTWHYFMDDKKPSKPTDETPPPAA